jgi:hypothetical protein
VNAFKRWRLAVPLALLSLLPLAATIIGIIAFWRDDGPARRAITVFLAVMFAACFAVALSIGLDHRMQSPPWLRIGIIAVFLLLGCGVGWVRDLV